MDSALARTNPATARGQTQASVPPHTITSADPAWMNLSQKYLFTKDYFLQCAEPLFCVGYVNPDLYPSPTACDPVAQAVETELLGPRKPCAMLMWPGARLGRILRGDSTG